MLFFATAFALYFGTFAWATPVIWDGLAPFNYTAADINESVGPYLSIVKGKHKPIYYYRFLDYAWGDRTATPLWSEKEQPIGMYIDKTSIFIPQGGVPQNGFRRSEIIAQSPEGGNRTAFNAAVESGTTVFHFSVHEDKKLKRPLNFTHEYQLVFIEKPDGSHVFDLQTGTPFNTTLSSTDATSLRIRAHDGSVVFSTPFKADSWHNFAVVIDWDRLTLKVLYSLDAQPLEVVTAVLDNSSAGQGPQGQGDFHFGVLKLPLIDPSETPAEQADVVHFGIQENSHEQLLYSGLFIESAENGVSTGYGKTLPVQG